jgi:hypothetical protein
MLVLIFPKIAHEDTNFYPISHHIWKKIYFLWGESGSGGAVAALIASPSFGVPML